MRTTLKSITGRNFWLRYLTLAPHRLLICARQRLFGYSDYERDTDPVSYAQTVFGYYKTFSGYERFHGLAVEVGAGRSNHVAEFLLASGCEHVDLLDRFQVGTSNDPRIRRHVSPAETFFSPARQFDFILSAAVLEHLYDPLTTLRAMWASLKTGGCMVHVVDLRDHGLFPPPLHDLSFLKLSHPAYWPFRIQGGPNRLRASDFERYLISLGASFHLYVTSLAGITEEFLSVPTPFSKLPEPAVARALKHVQTLREYLAEPFRSLPDQDLAITGVGIVVHK